MVKTNTTVAVTTVQEAKKRFRYYCVGCTGVAFYSAEKEVFKGEKVCNNCGNTVSYDPNNYIALTKNESAAIN